MLVMAIAYGVCGIYLELNRERIPDNVGQEIEVLVTPGLNATEVALEFERLGVVTSARDLAACMKRLGIDRRIMPGLYKIKAGTPSDVARAMAESTPDVHTVQLIPGALFGDIVKILDIEDGELMLDAALSNRDNFPVAMRRLLPEKSRDRVVFLLPETYALDPGETLADEFVKTASGLWWKQHGDAISPDVTSADMASLGILASIVQKEALIDSDRPVIAGVFNNRLKRDMPLQSCATVVHAWKLRGVKIKTVSYNDTKIDSPFNTYIYKGLPPENIGVPSVSSWSAVLEPEDTDMFFFVAKGDGSHVFTRTYKEHLEAQKKIRKGIAD
jgi:UPF0755 protein